MHTEDHSEGKVLKFVGTTTDIDDQKRVEDALSQAQGDLARINRVTILVSVSDTGMGFPPQLAEQIFEAFFTTKPQGTGMGLRICRSIIESHSGRLWAVGTPGHGATFHFSLPAGSREPRPPQHGPR